VNSAGKHRCNTLLTTVGWQANRGHKSYSSSFRRNYRWQIYRCAHYTGRNANTKRGAKTGSFVSVGARFRCCQWIIDTGWWYKKGKHLEDEKRPGKIESIGRDIASYGTNGSPIRQLTPVVLGSYCAANNLESQRRWSGCTFNTSQCSGQDNIRIPTTNLSW
jgi:hypothetical protein